MFYALPKNIEWPIFIVMISNIDRFLYYTGVVHFFLFRSFQDWRRPFLREKFKHKTQTCQKIFQKILTFSANGQTRKQSCYTGFQTDPWSHDVTPCRIPCVRIVFVFDRSLSRISKTGFLSITKWSSSDFFAIKTNCSNIKFRKFYVKKGKSDSSADFSKIFPFGNLSRHCRWRMKKKRTTLIRIYAV